MGRALRSAGWTAALTLVVAALPATAGAATFCVMKPGCVGPAHVNLQDALTAAQASPGRDRIELGVYVDNLAADNASGSPVDIVGSGDGTLLIGPSTALTIGDATSTVSNLRVDIGASGRTGISTFGEVNNVTVTAPAGLTSTKGIRLRGTGRVIGSRVTLPTVTDTNNEGIHAESPAGAKSVEGTSVQAMAGIVASLPADVATPLQVRRVRVLARTGIASRGSAVVVDDALVETLPFAGSTTSAGLSANPSMSTTATMLARHVTLIGPGSPSQGVHSADIDPLAPTSSIVIANSIVSGYGQDLSRVTDGTITANWSRFATGSTPTAGANNTSTPPVFVNPAARDFRLAAGSAMIDAGDPVGLAAGEPATDLDGSPRLVDAGPTGCGRRDMGAIEFLPAQRPPRAVVVGASPATGPVGFPFSFNASACDPDGDPVTFAWSFDDGGTAPGAAVSHAFATPGTRMATLTASDPGGRGTAATTSVTVTGTAPPPGPPPPGPPGPPAPAATVQSFSMLRTTFAVGTRPTAITGGKRKKPKPKRGSAFRYRLSRAAPVRITIEALVPGRRSKGKCVKPTRALRKAKKCTRVAVKGTFRRAGRAGANSASFSGRIGTKALKPGRYRAKVATVASPTRTRTASFRIVASR